MRRLSAIAVTLAACGPSGSAPELSPVEDQVVAVNQELILVLAATDEDGDELDYDYSTDVPDIDGRATIAPLSVGGGEFHWTPLAADVGIWEFEFSASDGQNSDSVTARIDVRNAIGENSAPRFLHPQGQGTQLDLTDDDCAEIDIEIIDSDSTDVNIEQVEPVIEGAELEQTSGLTAIWRWCPTEAQIEADDRYTAVFGADDGDNPLTSHPYLIVLRRPQKPDCPGAPPVIAHTPADEETLVGLTVAADISDDAGLKHEPLFYYSESAPSDPPDLSQMTQVSMQLIDGDMADGTWAADVPNPVAGLPEGTERTLHYVIVASDDDDPVGSCDHLTQMPASGAYEMTVTNPGGQGGAGLCEPCTDDVQCGQDDDHCVRVGAAAESFCLAGCDDPSDCPTDYTCTTEAVTSVNGASARQCVPSSSDCADPDGTACIDDIREDNDNTAQAISKNFLGKGTHDLISCPSSTGTGDDEDWFRIYLSIPTQVDVTIDGSDVSDLDLALYSQETGQAVDSSSSFTSQEAVGACLEPGFYFIRVYAFSAQRNPYRLVLTRNGAECAATCEADENEEDDSLLEARPTDLASGPHVSTTQSICAGDDDWYEIELENSQTLSVDLTFEQTSSQEDLDIHLFDEDGIDLTPCSESDPESCLLDNGQSGDSDEHFEATEGATGCPCTYYVVVRGYGGSENLYDISIEAQ